MLLRQMQYFLAAVACKNFGEAAKLCYVSQPAFSLQMKNLEQKLGVKLIQRNNRSFELTPAGERFYGPCKKIVGEIDALTKEIQDLSKEYSSPQFTIGCRQNYNLDSLLNSVITFNSSSDNCHLKIIYGDYHEFMEMLKNKEIQFFITDERFDDYSSFNSELLETSNILAALTPGSIPANKESIDLNELNGFTCVYLANKEYQIQEQEYIRQIINFHGNFAAAKNIPDSVTQVINNLVPAFIPLSANNGAPHFYAKFTKILPLLKNNKPIPLTYKIYWLKDKDQLTAIAQKLIQLLKEHDK
ncbi:LysR family transcriptional regulator [uncultured Phascolarctobacterium sp.]|uniref:LysR family transcriptional regulator n=1 Tax=uncultured Phascolarctobacterium sp. TaxID=512296 RepID=UPI0027D9CBD3|nr:LysR family transcriptional regulator [uncultured Phascolarctobacterium sp.]